MRRLEQLEALLVQLGEPTRMLMRAALVALQQGRLDASARTCADQVAKRPAEAFRVALLLALESTEIQRYGTVAFSLPELHEAIGQRALFVRPPVTFFDLKAWEHEEEHGFGLRVLPRRGDECLQLIAWPLDEEAFSDELVHKAIACLLGELAAFMGSPCNLRLLDEPM